MSFARLWILQLGWCPTSCPHRLTSHSDQNRLNAPRGLCGRSVKGRNWHCAVVPIHCKNTCPALRNTTSTSDADVGSRPSSAVRSAVSDVSSILLGSLIALQAVIGSAVWPDASSAVLNSPQAVLPRTAETALRKSIPAFNGEVQEVQNNLEDIAASLRIPQRKPWGTMSKNVAAAIALSQDSRRMLFGVSDAFEERAKALLEAINRTLYKVEAAVDGQDQDRLSLGVNQALALVADLKLLQAPGVPFIIPKEFDNLSRLTGRATVELTVRKTNGTKPFMSRGVNSDEAKMTIVLDGYSAPISAGNFAANVQNGLYDGKPLSVNNVSIAAGAGTVPDKLIPLEILPAGQFDPLYGSPLDVQYGERPVLPLSIYGAVSMAHAPGSESYASADEFFVYKFDRGAAGLAGMAFEEGAFGVFGYVTKGAEVVGQLATGDEIVKARLLDGADRLVAPKLET
ncbi:unnamed protein product [Ostreobium quekettii]|uniref:PPIase cyclophilin-type domain-containing protein n=1 Tax=Ostreobium quekettii TaxID=121088 RepID=A0A8S1IYS2_9CHLO|nr:unnamed protein product [Ostreobium quekettii]|eukprot:evm.model.scf_439.2 EVM.evm.TU.scf_439.2   scf_439:15905-19198(+)